MRKQRFNIFRKLSKKQKHSLNKMTVVGLEFSRLILLGKVKRIHFEKSLTKRSERYNITQQARK